MQRKTHILQMIFVKEQTEVVSKAYLCCMKELSPILCITGSDNSGLSGIQADIKAVKDLGANAVTAVTSVTVRNVAGIHAVHHLPCELVVGQVRDVCEDVFPKAVKVGLITGADTIYGVRQEIAGCSSVVCSPGILSSQGVRLMDDESVRALLHCLLPICRLLMLKCSEAELILGKRISTGEDMVSAARAFVDMGADYVMLRGGLHVEGRVNALLYGHGERRFFSSYNVEGWQRHGVGGVLSTAIAVRLAFGDDMPTAVSNAHDYIHSQIVYAADDGNLNIRPRELYDRFLSLVSEYYRERHDVAYYAGCLSITMRYLAHVTRAVSGKTPKQIIDGRLLSESERLLLSTSLSVQEIAARLGFTSQMVFARFFKSFKHCSASEYRRDSANSRHQQ